MKRLLLALGFVALTGSAFAQNWSKELEKAAKGGDATAQYQVGLCYYNGDGIAKDEANAAKWFLKSMKSGNLEARKMFYSFYSKELEKLSNKGDVEAMCYLGLCYYNGSGITKDIEKAAYQFALAKYFGSTVARDLYYSFDSQHRKSRTKLYKFENGATVMCESETDSEGHVTFKENTFVKYCNGIDTICGIIKGARLLNATFIRGTEWKFEGDVIIGEHFKAILYDFNHGGNRYSLPSFSGTLLAGGKLTRYGNPQYYKGIPIWNSKDIAFEGILSKNVKEELKTDGLGRINSSSTPPTTIFHGLAIRGTNKFLIPKGIWTKFFPYDTYCEMEGEYGSYAYGTVTYQLNEGSTYFQSYAWELPNGANITYDASTGEKLSYFSANDQKPLTADHGDITTSTNIRLRWDTEKNGNEEIYKLTVVTDEGDSISVSSNNRFRIMSTGESGDKLRYSLANGMKAYMSGSKARAAGISDYTYVHIVEWDQSEYGREEGINGTYTYANGRTEQITDGWTESQTNAAKARAAAEEAAAKAAYNAKCAKYGKVYVDAAAERKLMVGMHLDLVKEIYGENYLRRGRVYSDGTSYYYVESMAGTILVSVWFRNDKVTDFSLR